MRSGSARKDIFQDGLLVVSEGLPSECGTYDRYSSKLKINGDTIMSAMLILITIVIAVVSYLLGSISFAVIITNHFSKKDIRSMGSKNAGATNVMRSVGTKAGVLTLLGDFSKVVLSIVIARLLLQANVYSGLKVLGTYWAGFFCVLGHLYPIYFKFKGGKGVMTSAGMILLIDPRVFCVVLAVFLVVLLLSRMVSLSSISAAISFPIATWFMYREVVPGTGELTRLLQFFYNDQRGVVTTMALIFAVIVVIKHWSNIRRIFNGTESKMSFKRKKIKKEG